MDFFFCVFSFLRGFMLLKAWGPAAPLPRLPSTQALKRCGFSSPGTPQKHWANVATFGVVLTDVLPPRDSHEGLRGWEKVLPPRIAPHKHSSPPCT